MYQPIASGLLRTAAAAGGPLRLLIDGSKVGHGQQLLMTPEHPWQRYDAFVAQPGDSPFPLFHLKLSGR